MLGCALGERGRLGENETRLRESEILGRELVPPSESEEEEEEWCDWTRTERELCDAGGIYPDSSSWSSSAVSSTTSGSKEVKLCGGYAKI